MDVVCWWMLLSRLRTLVVQMPSHPNGTPGKPQCYQVPSATTRDGRYTVLRKPKELEVALALAKQAGCPVVCKYTAEEAAALDENDPALYMCVKMPDNADELLVLLRHMKEGGTNGKEGEQQQWFR
jgi:hypothetical protein